MAPIYLSQTCYSIHNFEIGTAPQKEEIHLLDCGKILKNLNFNKAKWKEIHLDEMDWGDMEEAVNSLPTTALSIFMDELIPILEKMSQLESLRRNLKKKDRQEKKFMLEETGKVKAKTTHSINKLTKLLQDKSEMDQKLVED